MSNRSILITFDSQHNQYWVKSIYGEFSIDKSELDDFSAHLQPSGDTDEIILMKYTQDIQLYAQAIRYEREAEDDRIQRINN